MCIVAMADPGGARKKDKDPAKSPARRPRGWSSFAQPRHGDEPADPYPPLVRSGGLGKVESAAHNAKDYATVARKGVKFFTQNEKKGSGSGKAFVDAERDYLELNVADIATNSVEKSKLCAEFEDHVANGIPLSVPPEPEWEEDDIYLKLRKDALRVSRSMSRHARAAANAYNRGDHYRAKQLSKEAREEQELVAKFNAEAAAEILRLRNENVQGDIWTIDLHGLHTGEAIEVLQKKLSEFEAYSASSSRYSEEPLQFKQLGDSIVSQGSSTDIASFREGRCGVSTSSGLGTLSSSMQRELIVITGLGVHSRNGASLPNAVKTFLITNSYRFSEPRPGIFAIQLKWKFSLKEKV